MACFTEDDLLEFEKLVNADEPLHVLAMATRLATIARRETEEFDRELLRLEDLLSIVAGDRDLSGPRESVSVLCHIIVFDITREMSGAVEIRLADDGRSDDRHEAFFREKLKRIIPHSKREECPIALQEISAEAV